MSKSKRSPVPVELYGSMADHYLSRVRRHAQEVVDAMTAGDIAAANESHRHGVFAQQHLDHYRRMASCVGTFPLALGPSTDDQTTP